MFIVDLDDIICRIIDSLVTRTQPEFIGQGIIRKKGVIFKTIRLTVLDEIIKEKKTIECMIICCGTSVFALKRQKNHKRFHWEHVLNTDWINLSNHDSCWRDAIRTFLNEIFRDLCNQVNPNAIPAHLKTEVSLGFSELFQLVNVDLIPDKVREPANDYWKKIINIEKI